MPIHSTVACPRSPRMRPNVRPRRRTRGGAAVTSALQGDDGPLGGAPASGLDHPQRLDAGRQRHRRRLSRSGSLAPSARRTPRSGLARSRTGSACSSVPSRPQAESGSSPKPASRGDAPARSCVLLHVEAPLHVGGPRPERPQARARLRRQHRSPQVRAGARPVLQRDEEVVVHLRARRAARAPPRRRTARAPAARAPGRSGAGRGRTARRPRPRARRPSRHLPASTSGRQRSKRDSSRSSSPTAPSSTSRRSVRKSPSQRRLWNTARHDPARRRRLREPLALRHAGRQRLVDHHVQPRLDGGERRAARARGSAPRPPRGRANPPRRTARRPTAAPWHPGGGTLTCAARSSFDVTTDASSRPGTASTSGAWNADPARP